MSQNPVQKPKKSLVVRSSVAIDQEVMEKLDELALIEKTNRTTVIKLILTVVCSYPVSKAFEAEKEYAKLNTAQMLERIIELYLELVSSPEIEKLSQTTFRSKPQMIRQLVRKGIQLYDD